MKRIARTTGVLVGIALLAAGTAGPSAAAPSHWTSYVFPYGPEVTEEFCDVPGLDVEQQGAEIGRERYVAHGPDGFAFDYIKAHFDETWTNVANGKFVRVVGTYHGGDIRIIDNGDGTQSHFIKNKSTTRTYRADGQLLAHRSGLFEFEVLWGDAGTPTDPTDDIFLEFVGTLKSTGHDDHFCDVAVPAIT